jgi:hypothetical protein
LWSWFLFMQRCCALEFWIFMLRFHCFSFLNCLVS